MTLRTLISQLDMLTVKWLQSEDPDTLIFSYRRMQKGFAIEPNILYIGCFSDLPESTVDCCAAFLCVPDDLDRNEAPEEMLPEHSNVIAVLHGQSLETIDRVLGRFFHEKNRYTEFCSQILGAVNNGEGLDKLVDMIFEMTGNPAFVIDTDFCLTAMSDFSSSERPDFDDQKNAGHLIDKNIKNLKLDKIFETIRQSGQPYLSKLNGEPDWLHDIVCLHGIEFGEVAFMEMDHSFTIHDMRLIRFFGMVVASVIERDYIFQQNRGYLYSTLMGDLVRNDHLDRSLIAFRMEQLGWSVTDNLFLIVVYDSNANAFKRRSQFICEHIQELFYNCKWTIYNGRMYFLLSQSDSSMEPFREGEALAEYIKNNHLTAAVSNCYHDILYSKSAAEQCERALILGRRRDPGRSIYCFSDYYMDYIASSLSEIRDPLAFCNPEVIRIAEYDRQYGTDYLKTLEVYFRVGSAPKAAAEELHIHKNTLFYRLNKIRELFHLDLQNGDDCFQIRLATAILEFGNMVKTDVSG